MFTIEELNYIKDCLGFAQAELGAGESEIEEELHESILRKIEDLKR